MDIRHETVETIRKFNRYYTVEMNLLDKKFLDTPYSLAEIRVLFEIWINKSCIQDTIVQSMRIDKSYLSRIVKNLCSKGIISKSSCKSDKRSCIVSITADGEREVASLIDKSHGFIGARIASLSDEQCRELGKSLSKAMEILKGAEQSFSVIKFEERYRQAFIDFNTEWIISNFGEVEKHDIEEFENIDKDIAGGGMIFFAVKDGEALATCMAKPLSGSTWELCKLGSNSKLPHKGAGSAVFGACMQWALDNGAERLFIVSNSALKPALHIYRKFGFKEIKLDSYGYTRGNIAFEYLKGQ
ncbi:MAG: helix-turn-helix domain-containing GNAT family N-acetyltransferase [Clostridia bacterium]|nr:helix-turn-helix domain-containing GNAT family N-acetyltransferase [Clostridia bacterium]